jgi:diaminopimelate decarboxylase
MLEYKNGELHFDGVSVTSIAEKWGTPLYVYSERKILQQIEVLRKAFAKHKLKCKLHYSVKANPLLGILSVVRQSGEAFDTVSVGEIKRCLRIGATASEIVFSGSGKSIEEVDFAIQNEIKMINVESESELLDIIARARVLGKKANVALRINPDVDALTHEYITTGTYDSKFGVSVNRALNLLFRYKNDEALNWVGLDMHIGSQLTEEEPIRKALRLFATVALQLRNEGFRLKYLDIGGGLGIQYSLERVISADRFAALVSESFSSFDMSETELILEPGRFVVAESGILVGRILHKKIQSAKTFLILDAGMTELIRPALYEAHHNILSVKKPTGGREELVSVVGPICESSDVFGNNRLIRSSNKGDLLVICDAGAYGVSMESTYNSRVRSCQVLLRESGVICELRPRENIEDLWRSEKPL